MKKIMTIAVLLGIAGAAAAPYIIGSQIESVTQEQTDISDQQLKQAVKTSPYLKDASFTLESYEKGYASSVAKSLLKIETIVPTDGGEPLVIEVPITSEISHGPYLGESGFGLAKVISRPDIEKMELSEAIKADTFTILDVIDFSGNLDESVTVKPVTFDDDSGTVIEIEGMQVNVATTLANRLDFDGTIEIKGLKATNKDKGEHVFQLQPFGIDVESTGDSETASGDYKLKVGKIDVVGGEDFTASIQSIGANGTYKTVQGISMALGEHEMTLANLEFNSPASLPAPVTIPELKFKSLAEEGESNTVNFAANYHATFDDSLAAVIPLPVSVKTADIDVKINSLPISALEAYMELVQKLSDPNQVEVATSGIEEQLPEILSTIINQAASLVASVKVDTEDGNLNGDLDVAFTSDKKLTKDDVMGLMMSGEDPSVFLSLLAGKGSLYLDKGVTDKAEMTPMVQMMGAPFVKLEGDAFTSELLIKDGEILVNGEVMPLFGATESEMSAEPPPISLDDLSEEEKAELKALMEGMAAEAAE
uniref:DUF945 domain-containing protein n=1 Tax=uncultured Thiotrichaceae bacterium TaxID=298394 RepID=A0A6S6T1K7_9GAMM|nr:MAG: Unknown protein [uncultured Thiotrichaceae bacterium]